MRNYRNQFPADYDVPAADLHRAGLLDCSWGNDVCPSFRAPGLPEDGDVRLWIEHPDLDRRESDSDRFTVMDPDTTAIVLFSGDDLQEAIAALQAATAAYIARHSEQVCR
jgi:hypothetical protein